MIKIHEIKNIIIKKADIDIKMIPVINYLNKFSSVVTWFCCQGSKREKPYVIFTCNNSLDLANILFKLNQSLATIEVTWNNYKSQIEYYVKFHSNKYLSNF
jgi:tRNA(Phe) wybutosine-synthesizing methylase Tyw3